MTDASTLTPFRAASDLIKVIRAFHGDPHLARIDLEELRNILPQTTHGKGISEIVAPLPTTDREFEGALMRDSADASRWGILYNSHASRERQRFTVAHEFGHLVLHRHLQSTFNCSKEDVYASLDGARDIEREADDFAANLLMPGDQVKTILDRTDLNFHHLSEAATEFGVSLEAMCLRFIKYTTQRAILIHWDSGFMKYHWRSDKAVRTGTRLTHRVGTVAADRYLNTVASDELTMQHWEGETIPAHLWCSTEAPYMKLRECKHSHPDRDRVLTLLFFEGAEPRW
ncbi:ImmA/IrrE family metallo-endopeptidase [Castellaniella hirudinis]|uniref:ImmA/IrrE family metallo-endopeptidase n=1 Tax=Castellaniella hirudinis TaxID=1144617 RepID=UPI0039C2ED61